MKKFRMTLLMIILVMGLSVTNLYADKVATSGSASVDIMSNYVWRGIKLSNSYVVQPSVGITYGGFGANLWSNWDSDFNNNAELTETDLTLDYSYSIDRLSLDAGYIYYGLEGASDTQEIYVSAGYDVLLSPSLTLYYDYDEGKGAFAVASVGHTLEFGKIALNLGASASYNFNNLVMGTDASGNDFSNFYNGEISASASIPLNDAISVEPKIAYSFPLSNVAENAIKAMSDDGDSNIIYGGVNLSLSF
ncbi:bacterial protein of unknown function [bacterium BMS3Abin07]|nr:bacterial protein of unknown function [bacterium BMS3Abin07]GBE31731.1 bacterial protein of unknown function [bacterium BMS3Bbin05]HDL21349.1 hypothetical protein [Nitrospirota bacterium]HDZ87198.1 hypothetical protein [Nitrospirota bacterium]